MKKDILFFIETEVQFYSLAPLLRHLHEKTKIAFDIIVPTDIDSENSNKEIYDEAARLIKNDGYKVTRDFDDERIKKTEYKILISTYMYEDLYNKIKAKYRLQFAYSGHLFTKVNYILDRYINYDYVFDAVLLHPAYTQPIVDIFSKSYVVPNLKLTGFSKRKTSISKKPILLFAPTYNEMDFAVKFLKCIDEIKKDYYVIMHGHHRALHFGANKDYILQLYAKADKVYDIRNCSIKEPLEEADVLVSDNSSVLFDAIDVNIPVAIFSRNPNEFHYREINTIQYDLIQSGKILWTNDPRKLPEIIDKTLREDMVKKQGELKNKAFAGESVDPIEQWMEVVKIYLEDKLPYEYALTKKYWVERIMGLSDGISSQQVQIHNLENQLVAANTEIASFLSIKRSAKRTVGNIKRRIWEVKK